MIWFLAVYLLILIPWGMSKGIYNTRQQLNNGFATTKWSGVSLWLKNNTPSGSIIFQTDWGSFPLLWYYNTHNYYLTGLDQTFMYEYNRDTYQQWVEATKGQREDIYNIAHQTFSASYLLLDRHYPDSLRWINRDQRFKKVYEDKDGIIFAL